jgi:nitrogen fixation protein NifB
MASLEVDLFNCMPYYPNAGSEFEHLQEPSAATVNAVRDAAGKHVKQMRHCTRCRSDAVGLLGEVPSQHLMATLQNCQHLEVLENRKQHVSHRPYVAVASMEGVLVNQHLGEAYQLLIYGEKDGRIGLIEARQTPEPGGGMHRWKELSNILADCRSLLVSGVGEKPKKVLANHDIEVIECEGIIEEAVDAVFAGKDLKSMQIRKQRACGSSCGGTMMGCGA